MGLGGLAYLRAVCQIVSWSDDPEQIPPNGFTVLESIDLTGPLIEADATTPFGNASETAEASHS
jgi:hypothetical protein